MGILKTGVRLASIVIAVAGFTVSEIFAAELTNPGFEASIEDPGVDPLSGWTPTVSDSVTVVGTEGPEYDTYVDYRITVEPASGELMARLGSPKKINEKQLLGPNSIEQTFTPKSETLVFAFRLFSWEHRGNDLFSISVDGPDGIKLTAIDGSPLTIPVAAEPDIYHTCLEGPSCTAIIGDGKRDVLLHSEWIQFAVRGLPTEGEEVTIKFSVESTSNKAHPTWAYFDHLSPELTLNKTADITGYNAVGNVINYTYSATNSGDISLAGPVSVADDKTNDESCPEVSSTGNGDGYLDPGESLACTASYTITQTDLDAGSVTNIAIASADGTVSNQDTVTVTAIQTPAITIEKSTDDTDYDEVGDVITYTYVATNSGNVTLSNVSIEDPLIGLSVLDCTTVQPATLAPSATLSCTATYLITQADLDNGSVVNTATVTGAEPDGNPVTYSASAISNTVTVHALQTPAIDIEKTADIDIYKQANDVITYTLTIENTGNVTLSGVTVTDLLTGLSAIDCGIAAGNDNTIETLAPLGSVACSATYTITTGDIPGSVSNTAIVTADDPNGADVSDSDGVVVSWQNSPPVASFSFSSNNIEGDKVPFTDESTDQDLVYGDSLTWVWKITGPGEEFTIRDEQHPTILFPDNGYGVTLTVTDSYGASDSTTVNLGIDNMRPLVTVLNQEIVAGQPLELFGRFIDLGYIDSHTIQWTLESVTLDDTTNQTYGIPFSTTGTTTADVDGLTYKDASYSGSLTVTDKDFDAATADFELHVLNALDQREPNNDLASAPALNSGWIYRSNIDPGDGIDIFEVKLPNGESLPAGSEILVKLKELPADFDLVVLSYLPEEASATAWLKNAWLKNAWLKNAWLKNAWLGTAWLKNAWLKNAWLKNAWLKNAWLKNAWLKNDYADAAWLKNAWLKNAWLKNPYIDTAWLKNAWLKNAWLKNAWLKNGFSGDFALQIPLSDLAQEEFVGEQLGGSDLSTTELPLDLLELEGVTVAGFSANRGLEDDVVLARTDYPGTKVYVAVVPSNGSFSATPYALQVEASIPVDVIEMLGSNCDGAPLVTNHVATNLSGPDTSAPSTLFVTQKERFDVTHGAGSWSSVEANLLQMSNMATPVSFAVLSIDSSVYDNWDTNPCSVEAANDVATVIRDEIFTILSTTPSIEHVVFIGSDNIIPHRRVPDETAVSNEKLYVDSQFIPGTPLFISTYQGFNLTDDYYVDNQPLIIQGRELYIPKLSNARLVESPDEINPVISAFVTSGGLLDLSSSLVTGYDFFRDGAKLTAQNLDKVLETPSTLPDDLLSETPDLTDDSWDLTALKCALLGDGCLSGDVPGPHDLNIVNTHYNHYSAITAFGYHSGEYDDVLTSLDILDSDGKLSNGAYATIGCHSGLSVPDGWAFDGTDAGTNDPNLDFPQAMSSQNILHIGSTGYGLGTDDGIGGTERLIAMLADELTKGGTVGQALVRAKQNYINNLSAITVYDEKSSIQTTMYGLPMYRLAGVIASQALYAKVAIDTFADDYTHTLNNLGTRGGYYTVIPGEYQSTAWRPIQPKKTMDVTSANPSFPVHDVLITGGSYVDEIDFDPVITKPKNWWEAEDTDEPLVCLDSYWPASIATVNSLPVLGELKQTLIVIPGQFRCTGIEPLDINDPSTDRVIGTQRNITALDYELTGSSEADDPDFSPPVISEVDLVTTGSGIDVIVDTHDDGSVEQIVLLIFDDQVTDPDTGDSVITAYSLVTTGPGPYTLNIPMPSEETQMLLQVVDDAGNVAHWSAKGANIRSIQVEATADSIKLDPAILTGTVFDFTTLLEDSPTVFYRWDFGDGTHASGLLVENGVVKSPFVSYEDDHDPNTIDNATFRVTHPYSESIDYGTATLKVTDSLGGIGVDQVSVGFCGDTVDDNLSGPLAFLDYIGCGTTHDDIQVSISLEVNAAELGDNQFRVHLDLDNDGKSDEMLKYSASNQSATGLSSLQVTEEGNVVIFTFNIAELGLTYGDSFDWYAETQDGVAGGAGQGFVDRMPDDGYFTYLVY